MRDELVEINGQRLHVIDTGGQGAVLLFAHGNQMDYSMWSSVIDLLTDDFRCIAWDMRLHGSSEDDGLPFTYWEAARDALAILDWTQVSHAILVGHSQGGFTALRAELLAPDRAPDWFSSTQCRMRSAGNLYFGWQQRETHSRLVTWKPPRSDCCRWPSETTMSNRYGKNGC